MIHVKHLAILWHLVGMQYGDALIPTIVIVLGTPNGKGDAQKRPYEQKYTLTTNMSGRSQYHRGVKFENIKILLLSPESLPCCRHLGCSLGLLHGDPNSNSSSAQAKSKARPWGCPSALEWESLEHSLGSPITQDPEKQGQTLSTPMCDNISYLTECNFKCSFTKISELSRTPEKKNVLNHWKTNVAMQ